MPCEVTTWMGATTFICSHSQPGDEPQPCAFCGAEDAPYLCDWPVERFDTVRIEDLRHGEQVRRYHDARGERPGVATVVALEPMPAHCDESVRQNQILVSLEITYKNGSGRRRTFPAALRSRIRVLRPGTCDQPACEAHVRELADEVHYCAAHWNAWEGVALGAH